MKRIAVRNHIDSISQTCWAGCDTRPTFVPPRSWEETLDLPRQPRVPFVTRIEPGERGLLFRGGRFVRILEPGTHRLWGALLGSTRARIEVVNAAAGRFDHPFIEAILQDESAGSLFIVVDLSAGEGAMVWIDGFLAALHGPGRSVYWNVSGTVAVERFNVQAARPAALKWRHTAAHFTNA